MKKITLKSLDVDVINFILHNNSATIDELCNCFDVSQVNIRTVLAKIEDFVHEEKMGTLLKGSGEYYFENNSLDFSSISDNFLIDDLEKKERVVYIILRLILDGSINLTSISKDINVSRITLNSDIEVIKEMISDFGLELTSVQWRGIFFDGDLYNLQKFSILFISKLYIEDYFSSPLKRLVNPLVSQYYREYLDFDTEKKILNLASKLYHYFNIKLGLYHYFVLVGMLIFIHLGSKKGMEFCVRINVDLDLTEPLNDILDLEDRILISDNTELLKAFLSLCVSKKYSVVFPVDIDIVTEDIYSTFNLSKSDFSSQLLSFLLHNIYFENRFFIPTYIKYERKDENIFKDEIALTLTDILERHNIPFSKKDICFLYYYLKSILTEVKKKNILIIDQSTMSWTGSKLKEKLQGLEQVKSIQISSYFNFKFFPIETYSKYDVFIFIDLPEEKKSDYSRQCCFINSYELLKNSIDISKLF